MAKKIVGIYKITCKKNGKMYIGQSNDIKRRFNQHRTQTSNKNLKADMELYGIDEFVFEILEECTVEELTVRENYYLDTLKPEYNILLEGQTVFVSDETREKQRKAKLGKKLTPKHCKKIAISNTGKKMSEEACRKHFKAVRCIETGQIFDSIQQAADFVGINTTVFLPQRTDEINLRQASIGNSSTKRKNLHARNVPLKKSATILEKSIVKPFGASKRDRFLKA